MTTGVSLSLGDSFLICCETFRVSGKGPCPGLSGKGLWEVLMHTAATGGGAGSPPQPVLATGPAVPGPVVTQVDAQAGRHSLVSEGSRDCRALRPGGTDPSTWPVPVLELLFGELHIGDLLACRQVCWHWRQVAGDRRLQIRCLLRTWPAAHRRQLETALDTRVVRARLTPWCDCPARPGQGAWVPSSQELLFTAVQRMLLTDSFHPGAFQSSHRCPGRIQAFVTSRDGRFMASAVQLPAWGGPRCALSLWHCGDEPVLQGAHSGFVDGAVEQLTFSSDHRRLRTLLGSGHVRVWQRHPQADAALYLSGVVSLFEKNVVHKTVLSADGKYLGIGFRSRVLIYGENEQGGWGVRPQWIDVLSQRARTAHYDPDHVAMRFSDNSRHFVFGFGRWVFVCTREGRQSWRKQPLTLNNLVRGQPALDASGRLLALACGSDGDLGWAAADGGIHFWRFEESQRCPGAAVWQPVVYSRCGAPVVVPVRIHPAAGYNIPVAFSPDGQLMAVPDMRTDCGPCIMPVSGPEAGTMQFRPTGDQARAQQGGYAPVSFLQFSANSCYLAMGAGRMLTLWQRLSDRWNQVLQWADPLRHGEVPFAFSPDGFHCVIGGCSHNAPEQVSVWGPGSGGVYRRKYLGETPAGFSVERVQFLPDGTRILVMGSGCQFRESDRLTGEDRSREFRTVSRFFCWNLVPGTGRAPVSEPAADAQGPEPG